ncbi:MAG: YigZ family protein, partial [Candidatus Cloacimonetes bacterium]|nr:YigZ family protein [Candidatus Cloacimonadota bacterium]
MNQLLVIASEVVSEIKIKRSRFIAHINRTDTLEAAKEYIGRVSQEQRKANHNCWALIIGRCAEISHSS